MIMICAECGNDTGRDQDSIYCENCILVVITNYFHRGYPYGAIVGLLQTFGVQMSVSTLKRRSRCLGFKRKGQFVEEKQLRNVIAE